MSDKKAQVIKVKEVSLSTLTELSSSNATAGRKSANTGASAWAQCCLWLNEVSPLSDFDNDKDVKDIASDVRDAFKNGFIARTGKMMDVVDAKTSQPKWSSWDQTRLAISYCGDIAVVIKNNLVDDLLVSDKSVLAKSDILKRKAKQPAIETIKASAVMIGKKFPECDEAGRKEAIELINALYEGIKRIETEIKNA